MPEEKKLDPKQEDQPKTPQVNPDGKSGHDGKGKGRNGRRGRHGERRGQGGGSNPGIPGSKHNDVAWYLANPALAKAVGSFSMNDPLGTVYHDDTRVLFTRGAHKYYVANGTDIKYAVPGIAAVHFIPTLPMGPKTGAAFINQLAMKLYIFVRHQNSGHANYEFADLMQALYAAISVNGIYGTLTRLYGTMLKYSVLNKYKAEALVKAQGFDYADIAKQLPDLYAVIERLRSAFDSYPIPKKLPVADRQLWMTANVFKDTDDEKSPLWLFVQDTYFSVPDVDGKQDGQDTPWYAGNGSGADGLATLQDIANLVDRLIMDMQSDEDFGIIFGDILKAYGRENCAVLKQIPDTYEVTEVLDANANLQLRNATICSKFFGNVTYRITQDEETHKLKFVLNIAWNDSDTTRSIMLPGSNLMLAFPKKDIQPGDMLVATRLCSKWRTTTPSGATYMAIEQCGTEILTGIQIFNFVAGADDTTTLNTTDFEGAYVLSVSNSVPASTINGFVGYTRFLSEYYQFCHLPRVYLTATSVTSSGDLVIPTMLFGLFDMACFVGIDDRNLDSLNYTAAMSEFGYTDAAQVG